MLHDKYQSAHTLETLSEFKKIILIKDKRKKENNCKLARIKL